MIKKQCHEISDPYFVFAANEHFILYFDEQMVTFIFFVSFRKI